jgi:hypothetical protein
MRLPRWQASLARTLLQALDFLQFVRAPAKSDNCPGTRIGLKASVTHSTHLTAAARDSPHMSDLVSVPGSAEHREFAGPCVYPASPCNKVV